MRQALIRVPAVPAPEEGPGQGGTPTEGPLADADGASALPPDLVSDLHASDLVLSDGYVGPERRAQGRLARLRRATFHPRRGVLRLELAVLAGAVVVVLVSMLVLQGPSDPVADVTGGHTRAPAHTHTHAATAGPHRTPLPKAATGGSPAGSGPAASPTSGAAASASPAAGVTTPTAPPAPATTVPTPTTTTPPAQAAAAPSLTPTQLGAQALQLVRYNWQSIPGYTIQFLPISAAPSPGFYGNTTFTWGSTGGTSVLYVYPGETVATLAGITAFEIGHEVDAAGVYPQGGEEAIENYLGIHPASWAPNCDCAEQGFLSGWYAAAFSNYWSPGVGNWSNLAATAVGSYPAAVVPWLNPKIS